MLLLHSITSMISHVSLDFVNRDSDLRFVLSSVWISGPPAFATAFDRIAEDNR